MKETHYEEKREKLIGDPNRIPLWRINRNSIPFFLLGAFLAFSSWWIFKNSSQDPSQVLQKIHYENLGTVAMSKVEAIVGNGRVEVPLDVVKERKLISFQYQSREGRIPLLAYITPSGKVVTAVSACESCNSTRFHIEGNELVCDNCFTRWSLETLKGISGGCIAYPPDFLFHTVDGGKLMIKEIDVQNWKPRFLRG
jgi:hypothetical protein